jgi:hypothetical protein
MGYRSWPEAQLVPLLEILPPPRNSATPKDWRGFDRVRLVSVLKGIVAGAEIEPVPVRAIPEDEFAPQPYRFRVVNGFHRYHASIIAGFPCLPAVHR